MIAKDVTIGFVGQGWLGRHYADHFEDRGYRVVRYGKEPEYVNNKDAIRTCDVVFMAVPTPTKNGTFDDSIVREALTLLGEGAIGVIKSTVIPGTCRRLQRERPECVVLSVPEFLREATARQDIDHPDKNIIGILEDSPKHKEAATLLLSLLAESPYNRVVTYEEAELTKYGANAFLFTKVVFMNLLYDLAMHHGASWGAVRDNLIADPRIGSSHMEPLHQIAHMNGDKTSVRGAGGHCFIKDFAAFEDHYRRVMDDKHGAMVLEAIRTKNIELLTSTKKDLDILRTVYGD